MMRMFRFELKEWDADENKEVTSLGFVAGKNYFDAVKSLSEICTPPKGTDYSIDEIKIYEIDAMDKGILFDNEIACLMNRYDENENA